VPTAMSSSSGVMLIFASGRWVEGLERGRAWPGGSTPRVRRRGPFEPQIVVAAPIAGRPPHPSAAASSPMGHPRAGCASP
jgi:hypothetical protein